MQVIDTRNHVRSRSLKSALALIGLSAALVLVLAAAAFATSPAMAASTIAVSGTSDVDGDRIGVDEMRDADCSANDERPGAVQPGSVVPGVSDILHAEFGLWWLNPPTGNPHPENPYPVGPHA